ncbi:MAG TPA: hypothetical protein VF532_05825 [Candidatus Angelobacter sp.]
MPRTLPTNAETWLAKRGVIDRPVILADVQTLDGTQYFWSDEDGYFPTKFLAGTRVQTSGGTSTLKSHVSAGAALSGVQYTLRMAVQNRGTAPFQIGFNYKEGPIIPPGTQMQIIDTVTGNGVTQLQLRFETLNVGDSIDAVAANPFIARSSDMINLLTPGALVFSLTDWSQFSASTVTMTPSFDTAPAQFYNGWIKGGFNFTVSKDFSTNAGDLLLQNLSGNTIDRDVALAFKSHEFEGALCIVRLWLPLLDASINEFHCSLSEQNPKEQEAGARCLQIFDPSQYALAGDIVSTLCTWRFKSLQCGSTGSASVCAKRFTDCQDATRAATERFHAVLTTLPNTLTSPIAGQGGGGRLPPPDIDPGNGGRRHPPLLE